MPLKRVYFLKEYLKVFVISLKGYSNLRASNTSNVVMGNGHPIIIFSIEYLSCRITMN